MGHRQGRPSVEQNLQDLVVVLVGGQNQRRDVGGERGRGPVHGFPTLEERIGAGTGLAPKRCWDL